MIGTIKAKLQKLISTKSAIKSAIEQKGSSVGDSKFSEYPSKILAIPSGIDTSDATANANDIMEGKTAYVKGAKVTGSIPSVTLDVPTIYVDSQGVITSTITQNEGKVSNSIQTATLQLPTISETVITPSKDEQIIGAGAFITGDIYINGDSSLTPENIKKGTSIFGVNGNLDPLNLSDVGNAYNILSTYLFDADSEVSQENLTLNNMPNLLNLYGTGSYFTEATINMNTKSIAITNLPSNGIFYDVVMAGRLKKLIIFIGYQNLSLNDYVVNGYLLPTSIVLTGSSAGNGLNFGTNSGTVYGIYKPTATGVYNVPLAATIENSIFTMSVPGPTVIEIYGNNIPGFTKGLLFAQDSKCYAAFILGGMNSKNVK